MSQGRLTRAEEDMLAAIERLAVGKPRNKDNKALLAAGRLRLNPTNVAREAGRSRQSVYRSGRVMELLKVKRRLHSPTGNSLRAIVDEVRQEKRTILEENQILISNLARAKKLALDLLRENQELRVRLDRRRERLTEASDRILSLEAQVSSLERDLGDCKGLRELN